MVDVVVREAATAFVHAREVYYPVARKVAGDLHVTYEGACRGNRYGSVPCGAVVRGIGDREGAAVAPRNIHAAIERRGRVVVSPTGFAIVGGGIVNAKMCPASSIRGSGRLVTAEALSPAARVQPHGEP